MCYPQGSTAAEVEITGMLLLLKKWLTKSVGKGNGSTLGTLQAVNKCLLAEWMDQWGWMLFQLLEEPWSLAESSGPCRVGLCIGDGFMQQEIQNIHEMAIPKGTEASSS